MSLRSKDFETAPLTVGVATELCNRSTLHAAQASGWWRDRLGIEKRIDTESLALGKLAHDACLFGLDRFDIFEGDRRTKAGKETYAEIVSFGRIPVKPDDMRKLERICDSFHATLPWHFLARDCEQDLVWAERDAVGRNVPCLGRADIVLVEREQPIVIDLKTCRDANPDRMMSKHVEYGYDIQAHAYAQAIRAHGYEPQFWFVFVEVEAPFATSLVTYDATAKKLGEMRWEYAKTAWASFNSHGIERASETIGYGKRLLTAPKWALEQAMLLSERAPEYD